MSPRSRRRLIAPAALVLIGVTAPGCAPDGTPTYHAETSPNTGDGTPDGLVLDVRRDPG